MVLSSSSNPFWSYLSQEIIDFIDSKSNVLYDLLTWSRFSQFGIFSSSKNVVLTHKDIFTLPPVCLNMIWFHLLVCGVWVLAPLFSTLLHFEGNVKSLISISCSRILFLYQNHCNLFIDSKGRNQLTSLTSDAVPSGLDNDIIFISSYFLEIYQQSLDRTLPWYLSLLLY